MTDRYNINDELYNTNQILKMKKIKKNKKSDTDLDLQVFYNTIDNSFVPLGSSYKYTMPYLVNETLIPSYNSQSERQKRTKMKEFFNENKNECYDKYIFHIFIGVFIFLFFFKKIMKLLKITKISKMID